MCILFFRFGNSKYPLILCSNRDEVYKRKSAPGKVFTDSGETQYYPLDCEAGGTWLGLNGTHGLFGVLLNYHDWRLGGIYRFYHYLNKIVKVLVKGAIFIFEYLLYCIFAKSKPIYSSEIALSRGNLVLNFIKGRSSLYDNSINSSEDGRIGYKVSADDSPDTVILKYISTIHGDLYNGFTLLLGCKGCCYYVCNYTVKGVDFSKIGMKISGTELNLPIIYKLYPEKLYGISNGAISIWEEQVTPTLRTQLSWWSLLRGHLIWEKVHRGLSSLSLILQNRHLQCQMPKEVVKQEDGNVHALVNECLNLLLDQTPCSDPNFGFDVDHPLLPQCDVYGLNEAGGYNSTPLALVHIMMTLSSIFVRGVRLPGSGVLFGTRTSTVAVVVGASYANHTSGNCYVAEYNVIAPLLDVDKDKCGEFSSVSLSDTSKGFQNVHAIGSVSDALQVHQFNYQYQ